MHIIRSLRVLYKWFLPVVFGAWFSSCRYSVELRVVCPVCGLLKFIYHAEFYVLLTLRLWNLTHFIPPLRVTFGLFYFEILPVHKLCIIVLTVPCNRS
jgi:hypothetical protein